MSSFDIFKLVECAMSSEPHFLECPLPLTCGHHVCKKCVPPNRNYQFKCLKCDRINQFDLTKCHESDIVQFHLKHYLVDLSKHIDEQIENEIEIFKSKIKNGR